MILLGISGMMILGTSGCGDSSKAADSGQVTEQGTSEVPDESPAPVSPEDTEGTEQAEPSSGPSDSDAGMDSSRSVSRKEGDEDLVGDIKELGDGQFTVVAAITEELDEGVLMIASPGPDGDDSDFDHVTVIYDEDTDIYIRTIYGNGERYEDADASAEDLSKDSMVLVWGSYGDDGTTLHADQIQIEKFVR